MDETQLLARRLNRGMDLMALLFVVPVMVLGYFALSVAAAYVVAAVTTPVVGVVAGVVVLGWNLKRALHRT